jgi:3-oxoacyl-[acyl-carrier protein] reductase
MNLTNARILITGGSSGIGKATAQLLASAGAQVLITGRNESSLLAACEGTSMQYAVADMGTKEGVATTFAALKAKLGGIDVLINNAGIGEFDGVEDLTWEAFERVFSTNVFGLAILTKNVVPLMKANGKGAIINIASTASLKGFNMGSIYSASKFAVRSMTQCWQDELRQHNIRVMQVNPSEVTTAFANPERTEKPETDKKLRSAEIAHTIKSILEMDDRGFVPEVTVWATNPFPAK